MYNARYRYMYDKVNLHLYIYPLIQIKIKCTCVHALVNIQCIHGSNGTKVSIAEYRGLSP